MASAIYAPMVDMLTILLFFILKSFSMDTPVRPDDPDFHLPTSIGMEAVQRDVAIDITLDAIYLEGNRTASSKYYLQHEDVLIQELYESLAGKPPARVLVRSDGRVPYALLRKVLFTSREAGIRHVELVAISRAGL